MRNRNSSVPLSTVYWGTARRIVCSISGTTDLEKRGMIARLDAARSTLQSVDGKHTICSFSLGRCCMQLCPAGFVGNSPYCLLRKGALAV